MTDKTLDKITDFAAFAVMQSLAAFVLWIASRFVSNDLGTPRLGFLTCIMIMVTLRVAYQNTTD